MGLCSLPIVWPEANSSRDVGNLLQKDLCQHTVLPRTGAVNAPDPMAGHCHPCLCWRIPNTGRSGSVSCGFTAPFSWVLVQARCRLCPPRVSVSPVLWKFCNQIPLTFKVIFSRDPQSLCQTPTLGCQKRFATFENFFGKIVFYFVDRPHYGSIVELMATGDRNQDHPQEKKMQKSKMAV